MAQQPKSYKKFVATAATATLVASAIVPVASANVSTSAFTDVPASYKDAVDFVVTNNISAGLTATQYGISQQIKRGDAASMIAAAAGLNDPKAPASGFTDVPDRVAVAVNSLKAAGVVSGKTATKFGAADQITRGEAALMFKKAFELKGGDKKNSFTDVSDRYDDAVDALVANKVTNGINDTQFGTQNNIKRGDFAKWLYALKDQIEVPSAVVTSVTVADPTTLTVKLKEGVTGLLAKDFTVMDNGTTVTPTNVVSDAKGEVYTLTIPSLDGKQGTVSVNKVEASYNFTKLQVAGVSALNPTEIQVKFNQAVDKDSALDLSHYVLSIDDVKYDSPAKIAAVLEPSSLDGYKLKSSAFNSTDNTVTMKIKAENALKNAQKFSLDVKDGVLSADKKHQLVKYQDTVKTFNDTAAPQIDSVLKDGNDLVLMFNEPVKSIGTIKIDDITVNGTPEFSKVVGDYEVRIPNALAQDERFRTVGAHRVVAYDVADYATNGGKANVATVVSADYTISTDTTPPTVKEIKQVSTDSRSFDITFSEAVETVTASELELEIKKGNTTFEKRNDLTANGTPVADVYKVEKIAGNKYRITFSNFTNAENINPLYAKGESSVSLSVNVKGYKDLANNVGAEYKGSVSLAKDLTAPTIKPGLDNKIAGNKLVVVFDRNISQVGQNLDASKITVTDKDGFKRTVSSAVISGDKSLDIMLEDFTSEADYNGKAPFTVSIEAGMVQSSEKVQNTATSVVIKETNVDAAVTALPAQSVEVTRDKNVNGVNVNEIKVTYPVEMGASALNLSNYTLDNQALPSATKIAIDKDNKVVTITLPEGFAAVDNNQLLTISKDVKTKTGSAIVNNVTEKKAYTQLINLVDNTQPVLTKAQYLVQDMATSTETNRIKLTFSENVSFNTADKDDLKVVVGNATKAYSSIQVGNKANEVIVNLEQPLSIANSTSVSVVAQGEDNTTLNIKDMAGNVAKAVSVNVSGKEWDVVGTNNSAATVQAADNAVRTAEASTLQTDIDNARILVNALNPSPEKTAFLSRLNAIEVGSAVNGTKLSTLPSDSYTIDVDQASNKITVSVLKDKLPAALQDATSYNLLANNQTFTLTQNPFDSTGQAYSKVIEPTEATKAQIEAGTLKAVK